ncbi:MAG: hypothetical protein QXG05_05160 [Nitrososphaerota archaeon]
MDEDRLFTIVNQILQSRPDLTRDTILAYIADKKAKVGSGFLTDVGAAYLVASDLGINISSIDRRVYNLSEIQSGMSNISIKAHFLCISRKGEFIHNNTKGSYLVFLLFDQTNITKAVTWNIDTSSNLENITTGTPVLLNNVSVRLGRDGSPEIHMNTSSQIEVLHNNTKASIDPITQTPSQIKNIGHFTIVKGYIDSSMREIKFSKKDGTQGNAIQFFIRDENTNSKFRVILWNAVGRIKPTFNPGDLIRLVNVQSRVGRDSNMEFHGSELTTMEKMQQKYTTSPASSFIAVSIGPIMDEDRRRTALLYDGNETYTWTTSGRYAFIMDTLTVGDEIHMENYTIVNNQVIVTQPDKNISIIRNNAEALSKLTTKISEIIKSNSPMILDVVALSKSKMRNITLKTGRSVILTELSVGDMSGQAELIAWGKIGEQISEILPGRRLTLYGVVGKLSPQKEINLQLKEFSFVRKISD